MKKYILSACILASVIPSVSANPNLFEVRLQQQLQANTLNSSINKEVIVPEKQNSITKIEEKNIEKTEEKNEQKIVENKIEQKAEKKIVTPIASFEREIIGYSALGKPIEVYYSGAIDEKFFGIFSNIHGGYEWETKETADDLLTEFIASGKKNWLIIPSINPDELELAQKDNFRKSYYLSGRETSQ